MNPAVKLTNTCKKFGTKTALDGISFEIPKGKITGYLGPNGAGKTTTLNIICGVIAMDSGSVSIAGSEIPGDGSYKSRIGYVPENQMMYQQLTVKEHLVFAGKLYGIDRGVLKERIDRMLEDFGLQDQKDHPIQKLSKGNKQKTLIACGLIHEPEILFLDEPLNGLDIESQFKFKEFLKEYLQKGNTVLYSSHIMEVIERMTERIIIISKGRIRFDGMINDLVASYGGISFEEAFMKKINE